MATIEDMVGHEIAFREPTGDGDLLVFPSHLTRENPEMPDPPGRDLQIDFAGPVVTIYATLVVRLGHSSLFDLVSLWRNAAAYSTIDGGRCGIFFSTQDEGLGSLTLFYDPKTTAGTKRHFEQYILLHLKRRADAQSIRVKRVLVCATPECKTPFSDLAVLRRKERGFTDIICSACETRLAIIPTEAVQIKPTVAVAQIDADADLKRSFEMSLISASGEMLTDRFKKWAGGAKTTLALAFTDIVGSTLLSQEVGDKEMFKIRAAHFAAARAAIKEHHGYEIKAIGDAFMVAFRTVIDAVNFLLSIAETYRT